MNSRREIQQSCLFRVDTFEHELGVAARVELDKIAVVVVHLNVLSR